ERRKQVGCLQVEVVVRSVKVRGHDGKEIGSILFIEVAAQLNRGYLGDRIRLVGGFQGSRQQIFFPEWLRGKPGIDAGGTQVEQFLSPEFVSTIYYIGGYNHIVVN